jgi:hypothetical protein
VELLLDRLGLEGDLETVRLLRAGETLARAIGRATRQDPELGRHVAAQLRELGEAEQAAALEQAASVAALNSTSERTTR